MKNGINKNNIRKIVVTVLLIILGFVLQTTILQEVQVADVSPNLILILVVFIAYINGMYVGMISGFAVGFLVDCHYGAVIGICMLAYLLIGYICGMFNRIYYKGDFLIPMVMIGLSECIYSLSIYVMDFLLRGRLNIKFYIKSVVLPELVYTIFLSVFIYGLICKVYENKEEKGGDMVVK